jgi:hypothetical protein
MLFAPSLVPSPQRAKARVIRALFAVAVIVHAPAVVRAQHGGAATASTPVAPKEGTQFDFLVGQWELVARPLATGIAQRIHGVPKLIGTWKAWRALDGWGIEDEVRLTDASGNPKLLSHTVRYFDVAARHWTVTAIDVYKNVLSSLTADWRTGEMVVNGRGVDEDGKPFISRATFSKIAPASFVYRLDRSTDNGKTWTEGVTTIEAKRVAAAAPR